MTHALMFLAGFLIGGWLGFFAHAMFSASKRADQRAGYE